MKQKPLIFLLSSLLIFVLCSCGDANANDSSSKNYDEILYERAAKFSEMYVNCENPYYTREFNVKKLNYLDYKIMTSMGEKNFSANGSRLYKQNYTIKKSTDIDSSFNDVIESSSTKILNYVKTSNVFSRPDEIISYLGKISFKSAKFEGVDYDGAYYSENDKIIYVSNKAPVEEFIITREYIHAISCFTHSHSVDPSKSNRYYETFTDVIADSISDTPKNKLSDDNSMYYNCIYPYIYYAENSALKSYYYGETLVESDVSKDELNLLQDLIDEYDEHSDSQLLLNHLYLSWMTKKK